MPSLRILVVNAGSSSLKLQVLEAGDAVTTGKGAHVEGWDGRDVAPIAELVDRTGPVDAVGHRVVHGGPELQGPTVIDDTVRDRIAALVSLAPLHQPRAVAGIDAARAALPDVPHVACFDTAYHGSIPAAAATYALPAAWRARWPVRRFGFHGLSHAYAARRAAELLGRDGDDRLRVVTCHLGAGASLCASLGGRSVDTTMGFTPLEGLVMATRAGSVDPGLVLWLITEGGLTADAVRDGLEHDSGVRGLAGSSDMRAVIERAGAGEAEARLALDVYVHRLAGLGAAMAASLGGLDALVFTGGVGERAPVVRAAAAERLRFLGVRVDAERNQRPRPDAGDGDGDAVVSPDAAPVATLVIEAREDIEIARLTAGVVTH